MYAVITERADSEQVEYLKQSYYCVVEWTNHQQSWWSYHNCLLLFVVVVVVLGNVFIYRKMNHIHM